MNQEILGDHALDVLFREARTHRAWQQKDVSDVIINQLAELLKLVTTIAGIKPIDFRIVLLQLLSPTVPRTQRFPRPPGGWP